MGVLHPYRGVMCYAVEPQGLKGASEHAYEKLSRIFGTLCQEDKAFRQADSLFALGNTVEELHEIEKEKKKPAGIQCARAKAAENFNAKKARRTIKLE